MSRALFTTAILVVTALVVLSLPASSAPPRFDEDFKTLDYAFPLYTSADWDTAAGHVTPYPFAITSVGSYDTDGDALDVCVRGDYVYVADKTAGLVIVNIEVPGTPTLVGSYDTPGHAWGVDVIGGLAFVADLGGGLKIINVSNASSPSLVGSYATPAFAYDVEVAGDYAYVAANSAGLVVVDISNPTSPTLAGSYNTPNSALSIDVEGNYAYIADRGGSGLQVVDIADPTNPTGVGSLAGTGDTWGVLVAGDIAYVGDAGGGLMVVDITDPTNPTQIGSLGGVHARRMDLDGAYLYVAGYGTVHAIKVSTPSNPTQLYTYDNPGTANTVAMHGEYLIVADGASGVEVLRVAQEMFTMRSFTPRAYDGGRRDDIVIKGDRAYVTSSGYGLLVLKIWGTGVHEELGSVAIAGRPEEIAVEGDYVYIAAGHISPGGNAGVYVVDVSNPLSPTLVDTLATVSHAGAIEIDGDYAYVARQGSGGPLMSVSIADPTNLVEVDDLVLPISTVYDVALYGDHAYVAGYDGVAVVDISDPTALSLIRHWNPGVFTSKVKVRGNLLYMITVNPDQLGVASLLTPDNPQWGTAMIHKMWDFTFWGEHVYGSTDEGLIRTSLAAGVPLPSDVDTLEVGKSYCLAATGDYVMMGTDVTDVTVVRTAQRLVDRSKATVQSSPIDGGDDIIVRARIGGVIFPSADFWLSSDSVVFHPENETGEYWTRLAPFGSELVWRAYMWVFSGAYPKITSITVDWLYDRAIIDSIADVPADQGGELRVHITRSGFDVADETVTPASAYYIWQRVDLPATLAVLDEARVSAGAAARAAPSDAPHGLALVEIDGRRFLPAQSAAANGFPPGTWEAVGSIQALQQDEYIARVTTIEDSTAQDGANYSHYCVTVQTTTPSVWFIAGPDSGYSIDNIAPGVPSGFEVAYNTGSGNQLSWDPSPEPDLQYYRIYRDSDPDFDPGPGNLVHATADTQWSDPDYDGWNLRYKMTAVDHAGNESDPTGGTATSVSEPTIPKTFALRQNVPNPFNPTTVIRYDVPAGGARVSLRIYDVTGQLIRTLVDGTIAPGQKSSTWDGTDTHGNAVVSGIYFYRLSAGSTTLTKKMVLLK